MALPGLFHKRIFSTANELGGNAEALVTLIPHNSKERRYT